MITEEMNNDILRVKAEIEKQFPDAPKTLWFLLWDDGDYKIEYRSGDELYMHRFYIHKSKGDEVIYEQEPLYNIEVQDEFGNTYYIDEDPTDGSIV